MAYSAGHSRVAVTRPPGLRAKQKKKVPFWDTPFVFPETEFGKLSVSGYIRNETRFLLTMYIVPIPSSNTPKMIRPHSDSVGIVLLQGAAVIKM